LSFLIFVILIPLIAGQSPSSSHFVILSVAKPAGVAQRRIYSWI